MNVREIMCSDVLTCGPSDSLETPARLMWEFDCGSVPVVDNDRHIVGIVTDRDICMAAWTQGQRLADIPVDTAMSHRVHSCTALDELEDVERVMREQRVRRVPVVDDEQRIVGIVSLNDIAIAALDGLGRDGAGVSAEELARTLGSVCEPHADAPQHASARSRASRSPSGMPTGAPMESQRPARTKAARF